MNFKTILQTKDKKEIELYSVIFFHLNYIKELNSIDTLNDYIKRMYGFINGYTEKVKLFKKLRTVFLNYPDIYIDWLIEYAKQKIKYLQTPKLKTLDDLLSYAQKQSVFGYLILIIDKHAREHLSTIALFSQMDVISEMLLNANQLKINNFVGLPLQMIEDYHLELTLDGNYLINDRLITLWQLLLYKVKQFAEQVQLSSNTFDIVLQRLIEFIIKSRLNDLKKIAKELVKNLT